MTDISDSNSDFVTKGDAYKKDHHKYSILYNRSGKDQVRMDKLQTRMDRDQHIVNMDMYYLVWLVKMPYLSRKGSKSKQAKY